MQISRMISIVLYAPLFFYTLFYIGQIFVLRLKFSRDTLHNYWFVLALQLNRFIFFLNTWGLAVYLQAKIPFHLFHFSEASFLYYLLIFVLADFAYYVNHWICHNSPLFWSLNHVVHHSSTEYNLSTAYRFSNTVTLLYFPMLLVLGIVGVNLVHFSLMLLVVFVFQIILHVKTFPRLSWLEYVVQTPAKHRVHHSNDKKHFGKNVGGVLTVWDLVFGTFQLEQEKIISYGCKNCEKYRGLFDIYFYEIVDLLKKTEQQKDFFRKIKILLMPPKKTT